MADNLPGSKPKSKGGRPPKHGGISIYHGHQPEIRRQRAYLSETRAGLIRDLGPTEDDLSMAQVIAIDRCITYLGAARAIEEWVSTHDFLDKMGVLNPAINEYYIAFCNGSLKCLQLLGFKRKKVAEILDLGRYKEAKIQEKAAKIRGSEAAQDPAGQAQGPVKAGDQGRDNEEREADPEIGAVRSSSRDFPERDCEGRDQ